MAIKLLLLGGTTEARLLSEQLAHDPRFDVLLSFAGRTESLARPRVPHRVGGFGGADGLATFLREGAYDALIDATHPFAARISDNAVRAASASDVPLLRLARPGWQREPGDLWTEVDTMDEAARWLSAQPAERVFLTVGRLELSAFRAAPQHDYLVRAIDPFETGLARARLLCARGPFALEDERRLLCDEGIARLVSKNAGTSATYAKIVAARALSIPVLMVRRPQLAHAEETETTAGVIAWLDALHGRSSASLRGV